ncbi:MAG: HAMP domain-containing sensor histidine kinase [Methanoregula sp.]|nr:HAMP domain-containing sensor histidine kinase [Methanoregula sp.]
MIDFGKNPHERNQLIQLTTICLCAGIVTADVFLPLGFVIWILYLVPLLMSVWLTGRYAPFIIAWLITGAILLGSLISVTISQDPSDLPDRAVFILMIAIVTLLVWEIRTNYTHLETEVIERRRAQESLEELARSLEERITKRTSELSQANENLIEDIKKRRKIEAALGTANQKLSLLSQITRHDISNRVFALLAELDLAKDLSKDPRLTESLEHLERTTMAIQDQIAFTKDYQEIGSQAPGWYAVTPLIRLAADQLKSQQVNVTTSCDGVKVFADAMISKVFYNLIHNAIRHGEHVTQIAFSYRVSGTSLVIVCEDNGAGIDPEEKDNIFRKGFGKDSGLGLFLIREILSITEITIIECGEQGKGARFEIHVPEGNWRI